MTTSIDILNQNTGKVNYNQSQQNINSGNNSKISSSGFTQLLLAQLKYQDPTNPVDDQQFVQQQAALAQVDQLTQLNTNVQQGNSLSQAATLVGKAVAVKDADGNVSQGLVSSVQIGKDSINLNINNKSYTADQIQSVYAN